MRTILHEIDADDTRCGECTERRGPLGDGKGAMAGPYCRLYDVFLDEVGGTKEVRGVSETLRYSLCMHDEKRAAKLSAEAELVKNLTTVVFVRVGSYSDETTTIVRVPAEHAEGLIAIIDVIDQTHSDELSVMWALRVVGLTKEYAMDAPEFLYPLRVLGKDSTGTDTYWDEDAPLIKGQRISKIWDTLRKVYSGEAAQRALRWLVTEWKKTDPDKLRWFDDQYIEHAAIVEREFIKNEGEP